MAISKPAESQNAIFLQRSIHSKRIAETVKSKNPNFYKEAGVKGAQALNANPAKKSAAIRKAVETIKNRNPAFYSQIGRLGALKKKQKKEEANA